MMTETRSLTTELRMGSDDRTLFGYAAKYNVDSREGLGYTERIATGAFDESLRNDDDVVALYNHNPSAILGRTSSGTLQLNTDPIGLRFELSLPDSPTGQEVRSLVKRGDLAQMSFAFIVEQDEWNNEGGTKTRTLQRVGLKDISVVTQAQYPKTELGIRSVENTKRGELYAELRKVVDQAHAIMDQETRNAEDEQKLDRLFNRVDEIESTMKDQAADARMAKADALLDKPARTPKVFTPSAGYVDSEEYRSEFMSYLRTGNRQELRTMTIGSDGAVVPTDLERALIERVDALSVMRSIARVENWESNKDLPVEDALGAAGYVGEGASITPVDSTLGTSIQMRSFKGVAACAASNEWLTDALSLNGTATQYVSRVLGRRLALLEEEVFVDGDGSSKPTGIFQEAGVASTTFTCASGVDTMAEVDADDFIETLHKCKPQYRGLSARWLMSDAMTKVVRKLKTTTGEYLWKLGELSSDVRSGSPGTILGYPVTIVDDAYAPADAASAKVAIFGDMSNFLIADRGGFNMLVDPYSGASTDSTTFYLNRRTDSHVTLPEAFSVLKLAAS